MAEKEKSPYEKWGMGNSLDTVRGNPLAASMAFMKGKGLAADPEVAEGDWWDTMSAGTAIAGSNAILGFAVAMLKQKQQREEQELLATQKFGEVQQDGYLALADRIQGIGKGGVFNAQPSNVNLA